MYVSPLKALAVDISQNLERPLIEIASIASELGLGQAPISVAVPIGVAANVCDINAAVLASQNGTGGAVCTATSTSNALTQAIARSLMA